MTDTTQRVDLSAEADTTITGRAFQPADVLNQVVVQGLSVSPDGGSVVYALRTIESNRYVHNIRCVGFGGEPSVELTDGLSSDQGPRVSPDGCTLLFVSDRAGTPQVWIMPIAGGTPKQLTDIPGGVTSAQWSPDSNRILFIAPSGEQRFIVGDRDDPTARRIRDYTWRLNGRGIRDEFLCVWVVDVAGATPTRVTEPKYDAGPAYWSTDGEDIIFVADLDERDAMVPCKQLWSVSSRLGDGKPVSVASLPGGIYVAACGPSGRVAYLGHSLPGAPGWANVDLYVSDNDGPRQLAANQDLDLCVRSYGDYAHDHQVFQPPLVWLDDSHIVALVSRRGASHPYLFGLDGSVKALAEPDMVCNDLATGGGRIVVAASDDGPADIHAVEDGTLRRLCDDGSRWFSCFRRPVEPIRVPSLEGHVIEGWLLRATGKIGSGPLVIDVHGGPYLSFGRTPYLGSTALADAGVSVIWSNPRGSGGYGEAHAKAALRWGTEDAVDILTVVDWAIKEGIADRDRIGITGLSQGGFMTIWLLGRSPGVFAAGVSENPVTDMIAQYGSGDNGVHVADRAVGEQQLAGHLDTFLDRSPFTHIHLNSAPLLLLHGEQDLRVPIGQSEIVFTILRSLGREVELVRYPDESHIMGMIARPDRRVDRLERIVGWFTHHLGASRLP